MNVYYGCFSIIIQVDVKCISPGDGGYFYPEHLPVLGMCFMIIIIVVYMYAFLQNAFK